VARVDTIVLGAGIVGTSIAVHLAKRGVAVALVDRGGPGEGTSYGNTGIIEGNTIFPAAFPSRLSALLRVALKRAPEANYHLSFLPNVAPWLLAFRAASQPSRLIETAQIIRPLMARAVAEHEALSAEAGADWSSRNLQRHADSLDEDMSLAFEMENAAAGACGEPQGEDRALWLLGQSRGAKVQ